MAKIIKNKEFTQKMKKHGYGQVLLVKGNGYFYLTSDENMELASALDAVEESRIYLNSFAQQSIYEWMSDISRAIKAAAKYMSHIPFTTEEANKIFSGKYIVCTNWCPESKPDVKSFKIEQVSSILATSKRCILYGEDKLESIDFSSLSELAKNGFAVRTFTTGSIYHSYTLFE